MKTLVVLTEEPSAKELLEGLLPRMLPEGIGFRVIPFEGKQDLERQLVKKIRNWLQPDTAFLVLRDQDSGDCLEIKKNLQALCREAGQPDAVIRIVCRELESWYLGDLEAVGIALAMKGIARQSSVSKYRNPDRLNNAADELNRLTQGRYSKINGSRRLGPVLKLDGSNRSVSFGHFCHAVRRLAQPQPDHQPVLVPHFIQ